ncbi:methyltransferase domain-containing protein [Niveispirillum sp. SYP-B3756]|uniref:class I SAM-dependent methyltransferase n=1 Tax=Niveispirillum sp. SYP-B3756 TaxID=2662178 RepID=UPI0012919F77|nr:class I SAM-dependent methyltransferase [Niveispirillum sp. SYP-B3756]MQP64905.1 methyltransferase domain-containing protein [Niveispirillum sp. SYP-B3756]
MTQFSCRACRTPLSRTFVDLGMSPLANSFVPMDKAEQGEVFYPLHTYVCEKCYLVQLGEFETPEKIFSDEYAYFSSFSSSWLRHAEAYVAAMVERFGIGPDHHVAEVASNDGYLLQYFVQRGVPVTGIEPAANCARAAQAKGVRTESTFFHARSAQVLAATYGKADLMAANNVLAHVPDISDFVAGFREMLKPEGVVTFEFPHLARLIESAQFDTIYHEHFSYLALGPVRSILAAQGLRVFDVQELPTHGGSLRVFACHQAASHVQTPAVDALLVAETAQGLNDFAVYDAFADRVAEVKDALLEFLIEARRTGKRVAGYGAPAKGNTLLNYCGVGPQHLAFTVDLNPVKQNSFLPGVRIPVLSVEEITKQKPDYLLILPWNLKDEIAGQMRHIREWGGRFVTAIPKLEVF